MRQEYDFSKAAKTPYAKKLKKQITIRLDEDAISYFKVLSQKTGIRVVKAKEKIKIQKRK